MRGKDLNLRPLGYEPNELPDCSTPHSNGSPLSSAGSTETEYYLPADFTESRGASSAFRIILRNSASSMGFQKIR